MDVATTAQLDFVRRRRRLNSMARPLPTSSIDAGSGTTEGSSMKRYSSRWNVQRGARRKGLCQRQRREATSVNVPRGNVEVRGGRIIPSNRKGAVTSAVGPSNGGATASPVAITRRSPLTLRSMPPTPKLSPRYVTAPPTSPPVATTTKDMVVPGSHPGEHARLAATLACALMPPTLEKPAPWSVMAGGAREHQKPARDHYGFRTQR